MRVVIGAMPRHHIGKSLSSISVRSVQGPSTMPATAPAALAAIVTPPPQQGVAIVAEAVHDEDVAGPEQTERVMQQGRIRPRIASVTAVPATRFVRSNGWMPRSMKPQWRLWPTVAVSTFMSLARIAGATCAGIGPMR